MGILCKSQVLYTWPDLICLNLGAEHLSNGLITSWSIYFSQLLPLCFCWKGITTAILILSLGKKGDRGQQNHGQNPLLSSAFSWLGCFSAELQKSCSVQSKGQTSAQQGFFYFSSAKHVRSKLQQIKGHIWNALFRISSQRNLLLKEKYLHSVLGAVFNEQDAF